MSLTIIQAPDPRLNVVCQPVVEFNSDLRKLAYDMEVTRRAQGGIGLAAPQVGLNVRLVSINPGHTIGFPFLVNPEIVKHGNNKSSGEEGCLSIDHGRRKVTVKRWDTITVRFQTLNGDRHEVLARGFGARVIQHEIDHLDGNLIA